MSGLVCPNCGTINRATAKFCMRCVTALDDTDAPTAHTLPTSFNDEPTLQYPKQSQVTPRAPSPRSTQALPDNTLLGNFRIVRPLGDGGFGIVYLAWDSALERRVAIKEYMPYALAKREGITLDVTLRTEREREVFDAGLRSFVNEARLLARFDHPALVKVFSFWEANRTAYMAMPYYQGPTLKSALAASTGPVTEQQLRAWIAPMLDALTVLHSEQCYHRDISPDNILLTSAGPLLLDFGAARHVISDRTQALTAMLKPGFAPIEQYGGAMLQGAWTDLYALAGVIRYAITGRPPVAAVARIVEDAQRPLAQTHAGRYSDGFLHAIDSALAVRPEHRPQDVAAFRALLNTDAAGNDFPRTLRVMGAQAATDFRKTERMASDVDGTVTAAAADRHPQGTDAHSMHASKQRAVPEALASPSDIAEPARAAPAQVAAGDPQAATAGVSPTAFGALTQRADAGADPAPSQMTPPAAHRRGAPATLWLLGAMVLFGASAAAWWTWPAPGVPVGSSAEGAPVTPVAPAKPTPSSTPSAQASPTAAPVAAAEAPAASLASQPPAPVSAGRATAAVVQPRPSTMPRPPAAEGAPATRGALPQATPEPSQVEPPTAISSAKTVRPPRCGELVLKASLEALSSEDMAYLKSSCR